MNETPAPETAPLPSPPPPAPAAPGRGFAFNPWLVLALALAALAVWQWVESRQRLTEIRQELAQRLQEADKLGRENHLALSEALVQIAALQAQSSSLEARQAEFQGQTAALHSLYQDLSRTRDEATLLEVEQAITLAAQQLQLVGNVPAALLALQAADAKLALLDRPQLLPLRKTLAADLEKLRALPFADISGMSIRLEGIVASLDDLPLLMDQRPPPSPSAPATHETVGWRALAADLWKEIKGLVRIQRFDRQEPVLLAPGQAFFLRENLKLRLLNARLALFARDQSSLRNEIKVAQDTLNRYFDGQDKAVQATQASLNQLASTELLIELPSLNDALAALRAVRGGKGPA